MNKKFTVFYGVVVSVLLLANGDDAFAKNADTLNELQQQIKQQQRYFEKQQQQIDLLVNELEQQQRLKNVDKKKSKLSWGGYGVIHYQQLDFFENTQDIISETRASTDIERIVLAPHFNMGDGYHFIAEIEFEHGGTGSTIEFEKEEAGEFELEVEKGGEVVLEQAYLLIEYSPRFNTRMGEMLVPFGMLNTHHHPTEYFTLQRSLAERTLLPSVWHESGVSIFGDIANIYYETQLITALDSSGFSGFNFVKGGMQSKLELDSADDIAVLVRVDYRPLPGVLLGGSFYMGDSTGNRPRKNMNEDGRVRLFEVHGRYEQNAIAIRTEYINGTIENSEAITRANLSFFQGGVLGVSKTPIGHKAKAWFIEGGYDFFSLWQQSLGKLFVFARYETFDTHADVEGLIEKVTRYDRDATTIGINYLPRPGVIFKTEFSQLKNASFQENEENTFGLGMGFEF